MGNVLQNNTNEKIDIDKIPIEQMIDYIATNYILTTNFTGLKKLYDQQYCNKLVILTSEILDKNFSYNEITYISNRIKEGSNEKTDEKTDETNGLEKDKVVYFENPPLNHLDVPDITKKKHMCLGIAKFYVKIAHIFAAIAMAINPVYTYIDDDGEKRQVNIFDKHRIPKDTLIQISKFNICSDRIDRLNNTNYNDNNDANNDANTTTLHPHICSIEMNKSLSDLPGIPELEELYYDDGYNYDTGKFTTMSDTSKEIYDADLKLFYQTFTGKPVTDMEKDNIHHFRDIKLNNYADKCINGNISDNGISDNGISDNGISDNGSMTINNQAKFTQKVTGDKSDPLIVQYADNLKSMMKTADENQKELFTILNNIFGYTEDQDSPTKKKQIRIKPHLKDADLENIIIETRELLLKLYIGCETSYANGIKIYEAIIDKQILETTPRQIETLENNYNNLL